MTLSTGKTGRGVSFEISDGASPPTWLKIANAVSITMNGRDAEEIDFTHLLSTGGFREFRQGFKDAGSVGIEYHVDPTDQSQEDLLSLWLSGEVFDWRINFKDTPGADWDVALTGQGFVKNPGDINVGVGDPIGGSASVRVTGPTSFVDI